MGKLCWVCYAGRMSEPTTPSDEGPTAAEPSLPLGDSGEAAVPAETPPEPTTVEPTTVEPAPVETPLPEPAEVAPPESSDLALPTTGDDSTAGGPSDGGPSDGDEIFAEAIAAETVAAAPPLGELPEPLPRRKIALPVTLFICTCASTFFVGLAEFTPRLIEEYLAGARPLGPALLSPANGLLYMVAVIGILLSHEMGHFVMTLLYRIPASLPFFIPVPIMPFGTMGAVIAMDGRKANRKEMFDMGLAGPLAGLVICVPVLVLGILAIDPKVAPTGTIELHNPLLIEWLHAWLRPAEPVPRFFALNQMNPLLMAGWVGMLITGLNMMPVSQLDGGHVIYALFGSTARKIARAFLIASIAYIIIEDRYIWAVMVILVTLIGVDHPPTADDTVPMGFWRRAIGYASLAIPVVCFPIRGIVM